MPGLSGVGGPPGVMMIHELDSLTMHGFSSRTTVPPRTRGQKARDRAASRTVMNNVTRMPSAGVGRLAKSMRGAGSVMVAPLGGDDFASHFTGTTAGAPLSLIKTTRNFAGWVSLAFRSMT